MSLLNIPLKDNPEFGKQFRSQKVSKKNLTPSQILGWDTETVNGKAVLLSYETQPRVGEVKNINCFLDVVVAFVNLGYKNPNRKAKRGGNKCDVWLLPKMFAWNLKYDYQAILKWLPDETIAAIIERGFDGVNISTDGKLLAEQGEDEEVTSSDQYIKIKLLEKKFMSISLHGDMWRDEKISKSLFPNKPVKARFGSSIELFDMLQFYRKSLNGKSDSLDNHGEHWLGEKKLDEVDVTQFDDEVYWNENKELIDKYAIKDAVITGELARLKVKELQDSEVRVNKPFSTAMLAEDNLKDIGYDQTIVPFYRKGSGKGLEWIQMAYSAYLGGWFEASCIGYVPHCAIVDLKSAYPAAMYHLEAMTYVQTKTKKNGKEVHIQRPRGRMLEGAGRKDWEKELATDTRPCRIGFIEVNVVFEKDLPIYPISTKLNGKQNSCLVNPRRVTRIITYDEYIEMLKWPIERLTVGSWIIFKNHEVIYPFRKFIDHHYNIKEDKTNDPGRIRSAKLMLNSIYGKLIQVNPGNKNLDKDPKSGGLFQPFYAATITGYTRSRLAELSRVNGFRTVLNATDGVIIDVTEKKLPVILPPAAEGTIGTLGAWEYECEYAEALVMMSGVYTWREHESGKGGHSKTTTRGSTPTFVAKDFGNYNWFTVCETQKDATELTVKRMNVLSLRQARTKHSFDYINKFVEQEYTLETVGNSSKRQYPKLLPKTFGDLLENRYLLHPYEYEDFA